VLVRASRYGARFAEYREQSRESLLTMLALGRTVAAARRNGRAAGILVPAAADTRRYIDLGFTFLMCGTDVAFLQSAGRTVAETMRNA
jgi:2-keto-3-deoxy-L-rhamnonate aldolase RhmA